MKNIKLFIFSILCISILSCGKDKDFKERERNPNIVDIERYFRNAVWLTDSSFFTIPLSVTALDKNFNITEIKQLGNESGFCFSYNGEKNKILFTKNNSFSLYGSFDSFGPLYEYDFNTGLIITIFNNTNVRGALYYRDDKIIYCARYFDSATNETRANLYMYDQSTKENNFIRTIGYLSNVSGFDIHPQQNKLLFYEDGSIVEYDMDAKQSVKIYTLPDISTWFRYNPAGNKIAYASPNGIGILDLATMKSKILNTNTSLYEGEISTDTYPCWSPNGKNIIYGSMHYEGNDPGPYKLYILKNAN